MRDLDLLMARQSIGSTLKENDIKKTKRGVESGYVLVILCTVLVGTIKANDVHLCLAFCKGPPSFLDRGVVELTEARTRESVFGLDANIRDGILFLLLFLFESKCHHAPGDVFHSLSVREVGLGAGIHLPDLCCKRILFSKFVGISFGG